MHNKTLYITLLFIAFCFAAKGQYKNDKWIVGLTPLEFDFKQDTLLNSIYTSKSIRFDNPLSNICDSSSILFSCNGNNIYDKDGDLMQNGDYLIPNKIYTDYINSFQQQSIIIPKKNDQFYVFIWSISDILYDSIKSGFTNWRYDILTYSIVDLKENNGKGKVISKLNYLLEHEDLAASQMSAVRHANGRDWWLVKPHNKKHKFYTFLITPDGIFAQPIQEFDSPTFRNGIIGQSNFSSDGSLYVTTAGGNNNITQVNKFDRCTGLMSKYKTIPWVYDSTFAQWSVVESVCFSPNNQFVYLINNVHIVQYDLMNDESIELNTSNTSNPNGNNLAYNAADGRIYIGNFNGIANAMSFIKYPNIKGLGAEYCKLCYPTKNKNTLVPPNMPNYELGVLKGSPCDTIRPTAPPPLGLEHINLYPNPVKELLFIKLPSYTKTYELVIYNILGQVIFRVSKTIPIQTILQIPVKTWVKGIYEVKIITESEKYRGKFVKE